MKYTRRFEAALVFASQLHNDHFRKATEVPYVTHLLGVASLVGEAGGNEDEVIAALLHDAVEDRGRPANARTHPRSIRRRSGCYRSGL